jgi:hypothetical protein
MSGWRLHDMRPTAIAVEPAPNPTIAVIGDLAMAKHTNTRNAERLRVGEDVQLGDPPTP